MIDWAAQRLPLRITVRVLCDVVQWSWENSSSPEDDDRRHALEITKEVHEALRRWVRGEVTAEFVIDFQDVIRESPWWIEPYRLLGTGAASFLFAAYWTLRVVEAGHRPRGNIADVTSNAQRAIFEAEAREEVPLLGRPGTAVAREREESIRKLILERLPTEPSERGYGTQKLDFMVTEFPAQDTLVTPLVVTGGGYALVNDMIVDLFTRSLYYEHGADTTATRVLLDWLADNGYLR
jgi:hypothetical protein